MIATRQKENWVIGNDPEQLGRIHEANRNIAIWNRSIDHLDEEINRLLEEEVDLRLSGDFQSLTAKLRDALPPDSSNLLLTDISNLIQRFSRIAQAPSVKIFLGTVNSNMCRRFHADVNDLRMLCTYIGPGTLWLPEDNVNHNALNSCGDNECIVRNEKRIQQVKTGSVVILKGAIYPSSEVQAIVHRSPTIEESGKKRLLLRLDTNKF
jgi:hypothetical protein